MNEPESEAARAVRLSVEELRVRAFESRQDYDDAMFLQERWLTTAYGVRPGTLAALVPYMGKG